MNKYYVLFKHRGNRHSTFIDANDDFGVAVLMHHMYPQSTVFDIKKVDSVKFGNVIPFVAYNSNKRKAG